jgi:hypothetical protein
LLKKRIVIFCLVFILLSMSIFGQVVLDSTTSTFEFKPADLKVYLNTTVNWTFSGQGTHTVTATDGSFEGEDLEEGDEFQHKFNESGTFEYHCLAHGETGRIVVEQNPNLIDFPLINITLVEPTFGVSFVELFDIVVETTNASICKYSAFPEVKYEDIDNTAQVFEATDNWLTHTLSDYNLKTPDNYETSLYVKCKVNDNGYINEAAPQEIILSVDTTPPKILALYADPNPVIERLKVDVVVETDDKVVCDYQFFNSDDLGTDFGDINRSSFKSINTNSYDEFTDPTINDNTDYLVFVACMNRAEQHDLNFTYFSVNLSIMNNFTELLPFGNIKDKDIELKVVTNKDSTCTYDGVNKFAQTATTEHFLNLRNLTEKVYTFPIECRFGNGDILKETIMFSVDWSKPSEPTIVADENTCDNTQLSASFSAKDNLQVAYYNVKLLDGDGNGVEYNLTESKITIINLSLERGKKYFWEVYAVDISGNVGSIRKTLGTQILEEADILCAGNDDPYLNVTGLLTLDGTQVKLGCFDPDPGDRCKEKTYALIDKNSTCEVCGECEFTKITSTTKIVLYEDTTLCYNITDTKGRIIFDSRNIKIDTCTGNVSCCNGVSAKICVSESNCSLVTDMDCDVLKLDTDEDLIPDLKEIECGLDPNNKSDAILDFDNDTLKNKDECLKYHTDINNKDTDDDGYDDNIEAQAKTDPTDPDDYPVDENKDTDNDGIPDLDEEECGLDPDNPDDADEDADGDTLSNRRECLNYGTDWDKADTDGDGFDDNVELDKNTNAKDPDDFPKSHVLNILAFTIGLGLVSGGIYFFAKNMSKTKKMVIPKSGANKPLVNFNQAGKQMGSQQFSQQQNTMSGVQPNISSQPRKVVKPISQAEIDIQIRKKREELKFKKISTIFDEFAEEGTAPSEQPKTIKKEKPKILDKLDEDKEIEHDKIFNRLDDISEEDAFEEIEQIEKEEEAKFGKIKEDDISKIGKGDKNKT